MKETLRQFVKTTGEEFEFSQHPFFVALNGGSMTLNQFIDTQRQFYHAVEYFSRPMAIVAARVPHTAQRLELMRNVWEEHGEGEGSASHGATFSP